MEDKNMIYEMKMNIIVCKNQINKFIDINKIDDPKIFEDYIKKLDEIFMEDDSKFNSTATQLLLNEIGEVMLNYENV